MNHSKAFYIGQSVKLDDSNHVIKTTAAAEFLGQKGILLEQNDFFCHIEFPNAKEAAPYNTLWVPIAYVEPAS